MQRRRSGTGLKTSTTSDNTSADIDAFIEEEFNMSPEELHVIVREWVRVLLLINYLSFNLLAGCRALAHKNQISRVFAAFSVSGRRRRQKMCTHG